MTTATVLAVLCGMACIAALWVYGACEVRVLELYMFYYVSAWCRRG